MKNIITLFTGIVIGIIGVIITFAIINKTGTQSQQVITSPPVSISPIPITTPINITPKSNLPKKITNCQGFVNIKDINPHIIVDIKYATKNNVFNEAMYNKNDCYLREDVAKNLSNIQKTLEKKKLGLKCWDCYRPLSVQKKLWAKKPDPNYVANPYTGGSRHNKGASVDITLVDDKGKEISMPTEFDDFSIKASHSYYNLTQTQLTNRKILKEAMETNNFSPINSEWWHYDYINYANYGIMDISFNDLEKYVGVINKK